MLRIQARTRLGEAHGQVALPVRDVRVGVGEPLSVENDLERATRLTA